MKLLKVSAIFFTLLIGQAAKADSAHKIPSILDSEYAKKMFERLTGTPILNNDPRLNSMAEEIGRGNKMAAARIATEDENFYQVTLLDFASVMSNIEESPLAPFDDLQATVIGAIRDELDFRSILTGTYIYQGVTRTDLPVYSLENNDHYLQFESRFLSLKNDLEKVTQNSDVPLDARAGVLTSRGWAAAHFDGGTNRRAMEYTFRQFLCSTKEQWKDRGLPTYKIRRDVDRAPGGKPETFRKVCRSCHAIMDGLSGSFAKFDFKDEKLVYYEDSVAPKMNNNGNVYPEGHVTFDDSWINFATQNHNERFGWRGPLQGNGAKSFGKLVANSEGFSDCMVTKVFKSVCRRTPRESDESTISELTTSFEANRYNMRKLFEATASQESCLERI